jgi:hypothetical protein
MQKPIFMRREGKSKSPVSWDSKKRKEAQEGHEKMS